MDVITCRPVRHEDRAYVVMVCPDVDSRLSDADCFTLEDCRAYAVGDWRFVTLVVMGEQGHKASLSSVVFGKLAGVAEITLDTLVADDYYVPSLIREVAAQEVKQP